MELREHIVRVLTEAGAKPDKAAACASRLEDLISEPGEVDDERAVALIAEALD